MKRFYCALFLFCSGVTAAHADKESMLSVYGLYGYEQKYDVYPGLFNNAHYFGGIANFKEMLELQVILSTSSNQSKNHFSLSYHYGFFKMLQPFINIGVGHLSDKSTAFHFNFDLGVELVYERFRLRWFHKSQVQPFGHRQYGDTAIMFAGGYGF